MDDICIIGGCGHIGIPLGLVLASKNFNVTLIDTNKEAVDKFNNKELLFNEIGSDELLKKFTGKNIKATTKKEEITNSKVIIFATTTNIDEHLHPKINEFIDVIKSYIPLINKEHLIILRSTLPPGTTNIVADLLKEKSDTIKLAYCPERIAQGKGIKEIYDLPQIVSATSKSAEKEAYEIFSKLTAKIIYLTPKEAELAKLMTNAWRYIEFSIANQFYMMAEETGLDFYKIFNAIKEDYPRAKHFPKAGLTAGPCLFKDTAILSSFYNDNYPLGRSAIVVNEALPLFLIEQLETQMNSIEDKKIALLGLTFKPDNDDTRNSLSFKIKKRLEDKMAIVLTSDPYIKGSMNCYKAIEEADGVILGVPHSEFASLRIDKPFVDCWGFWR